MGFLRTPLFLNSGIYIRKFGKMNSDLNEQQIWGRVYTVLKLYGNDIDFEKLIYEIEDAIEYGDLEYCDKILKILGY